jgi:hypothetical protein
MEGGGSEDYLKEFIEVLAGEKILKLEVFHEKVSILLKKINAVSKGEQFVLVRRIYLLFSALFPSPLDEEFSTVGSFKSSTVAVVPVQPVVVDPELNAYAAEINSLVVYPTPAFDRLLIVLGGRNGPSPDPLTPDLPLPALLPLPFKYGDLLTYSRKARFVKCFCGNNFVLDV